MTNTAMMGADYFLPGKSPLTWAPGAEERYVREHSFDPSTGEIRGPYGAPPGGIALQWQTAHEQAVMAARNRMAADAVRFAQGAAGLMSSYRPGGGAALQSNVYGQLAGIQLERASMLQPIDLMSDYRRHTMAEAGRAGRKEGLAGSIVQGLGAILSVIPGLNVVGMGVMGAGSALQNRADQKRDAAMGAALAAGQEGYQGGYSGRNGAAEGGQDTGWVGEIGQAMSKAYGQGGQQTQGPGTGQPGTQQPGPNGKPPQAPGMVPQGQPGQGTVLQSQMAPEAGAGGQQAGAMGGAAGGMAAPGGPGGVVGADGRFDTLAYAANGAMGAIVPTHTQVALSERMVEQIQQDPFWAMTSMAIDRELTYRTIGQEAA